MHLSRAFAFFGTLTALLSCGHGSTGTGGNTSSSGNSTGSSPTSTGSQTTTSGTASTTGSGGGGPAPIPGLRIFYSDLTSGPNTGGENGKGAFVTIYGNGFGATQGSSNVTVGGSKADSYPIWSNTRITMQLGSAAATGDIVVHVPSRRATSNGAAFTVRERQHLLRHVERRRRQRRELRETVEDDSPSEELRSTTSRRHRLPGHERRRHALADRRRRGRQPTSARSA